jgi:hypothetical protein
MVNPPPPTESPTSQAPELLPWLDVGKSGRHGPGKPVTYRYMVGMVISQQCHRRIAQKTQVLVQGWCVLLP